MRESIGSRREVWAGTKQKTSGGLHKSALMKNKRGRIVSKKKHALGLKAYKKNGLRKYKKTKAGMKKLRMKRRKR